MARITLEDAQTAVADILNANGGKMKYAALVQALNDAGQAQMVKYLPQLKVQKMLTSNMEFETPESSRAVSFVSLPGGGA